MRTISTKAAVVAVLITLFLIISAFFTTAFPLEEKYRHISAAFVILFALPCYFGLFRTYGKVQALLLIFLMSVFAVVLENTAIITGFPYGHFSYGSLIGETIGNVPWTVGFAWTPLLFGAYALSKKITPKASSLQRHAFTAGLMMMFDMVLDPGSVALGFWTWQIPTGFYGVPLSNFIGWLFSSFLASVVLEKLFQRLDVNARPLSNWMYASYFLMLIYWIAVCAFAQLWFAVIVGGGLGLFLFNRLCCHDRAKF